MDVKIWILLLVLTRWMGIHSVTISGSVSDHIEFIYEQFPVPPSTRAIIEVDVSYPADTFHFPILGIYTSPDHINIKSKCVRIRYGQLLNYNLHPGITLDRCASKPLKCENDNTTSTLHCIGDITVQDYKSRHFSFSFGFKSCYYCRSCSLKGLVYKLRIHGQTNETNCIYVGSDRSCIPSFRYSMHPNLFGDENVQDLSFQDELRLGSGCYQHATRFLCFLYFVPRCQQSFLPCREMCHDYLKACSPLIRNKLDCDYLPPNGWRYLVFSPLPQVLWRTPNSGKCHGCQEI